MSQPQVCRATYSNVPVWVLAVNGVSVMRRQEDGWVNATHLLKVANFDKPRRTRILERDVQTGKHEKVQGGYGKYQGTWVPPLRAIELARQFGVLELVNPLLTYEPGSESPPEAPKLTMARRQINPDRVVTKRPRKATAMPLGADDSIGRRQMLKPAPAPQVPARSKMILSTTSSPHSSNSDIFSDDESLSTQFNWNQTGSGNASAAFGSQMSTPYHTGSHVSSLHSGLGDANDKQNAYLAEYSSKLLDFFMAPDKSRIPEILLHPRPGFHINQKVDDEGHTALHWACAMGQIKVMEGLIGAGADINAENNHGHTALVRAVMFTNNYDLRTFPQVLELLKPTFFHLDSQGNNILHIIATVASSKSRASCSRYYTELFLAKLSEIRDMNVVHQFINKQDACGDTPLHIACRNGSRKLVKVLLSYRARVDLKNNAGRTAQDYLYEYETHKQQNQMMATSSSPLHTSYTLRRFGQPPSTPRDSTDQTEPYDGTFGYQFGSANYSRNMAAPQRSAIGDGLNEDFQRVMAQLADYIEQLMQTYSSDLNDKDTDIEQVRNVLATHKRELADIQKQIPELQSQLGPDTNQELQELSDLLRARARQLKWLLERTQARDLALMVQKEETDVQHSLQDELLQNNTNVKEARQLASELAAMQNRRTELLNEIIDLYATATSGERMDAYRRLVSMACGVPTKDIDDLLDGISQALEEKQ